MTDVRIRDVNPDIVDALRVQAKVRGTSMEAMLRAKLEEMAQAPRKELVEETRLRLDRLRQQYGTMTDSAELIRQDREIRG